MAKKASGSVTVDQEPEEETLDYRIDFQTKDGETVGSEEGSAKAGTYIEVPELLLDGYEVVDLTSGFELEEDGQSLTVLCEEQTGGKYPGCGIRRGNGNRIRGG